MYTDGGVVLQVARTFAMWYEEWRAGVKAAQAAKKEATRAAEEEQKLRLEVCSLQAEVLYALLLTQHHPLGFSCAIRDS